MREYFKETTELNNNNNKKIAIQITWVKGG